MLEGLNEINWSQLHHAYGEAGDVPVLINQLLSSEKTVTDKAVYELFGNIYHQNRVYEASAYAVPFLQEILNASEITNYVKMSVACLLASMADAYDIKDDNHAQKVRDVVDVKFLFQYVSCENPTVRGSVAGALRHYPQYFTETLPMLEKAFALENEEEAREQIADAIETIKLKQVKL